MPLDYPVVSGNVSLYNETNGVGIPPTPAIGGVGKIPDATKIADIKLNRVGDVLILIGREQGWLGQSLYQGQMVGKLEGAPPAVDLVAEKAAGVLVRSFIRSGMVSAVHDCSDGGLLVAVAEMALGGTDEGKPCGVELFAYEGKLPAHAIWFGEDQGRYVVSVEPRHSQAILERARDVGLPARIIGRVGGQHLSIPGEPPLSLVELRAAHEAWMPDFMH